MQSLGLRTRSWALISLITLTLTTCATRPSAPEGETAGINWQRLQPASSKRTEVAAAVAGGKIYLIGGFLSDGASSAGVEIFDPGSNTFSKGPDLPAPVNHSMVAGLETAVYSMGGYGADGAPIDLAFVLEGSRWRELPRMPEPRAAAGAAVIEGKLYVAGGVKPGGLAESVLIFDPLTNAWSSSSGPPTKREHLGVASFESKLYVMGGRTSEGNLATAEVLDVSTGNWSVLPEMPTARGGIAASSTSNGFIVVPGGEAQETFEEVEAFDVRGDRWRRLAPLPTPRHGLGVAAIGNKVYVIQGGPTPGLSVSDANEVINLDSLR